MQSRVISRRQLFKIAAVSVAALVCAFATCIAMAKFHITLPVGSSLHSSTSYEPYGEEVTVPAGEKGSIRIPHEAPFRLVVAEMAYCPSEAKVELRGATGYLIACESDGWLSYQSFSSPSERAVVAYCSSMENDGMILSLGTTYDSSRQRYETLIRLPGETPDESEGGPELGRKGHYLVIDATDSPVAVKATLVR